MDIRKEFPRTMCTCRGCQLPCEHMPGMMVPGDFEAIYVAIHGLPSPVYSDAEVTEWAKTHLSASPGALIVYRGQPVRIPTLVPRLTDSGCVFYDAENHRCRVHEHSPFGCSRFTVHMSAEDSEPLSYAAIGSIIADFRMQAKDGYWEDMRTTFGTYVRLWELLNEAGLTASPLEERRANLDEALKREGY